MTRNKKRVRESLIILIVLLISVYVGGIYYFTEHLLIGSKINNIDCSLLTGKKSIEKINNVVQTYELQIKGRKDANISVPAQEIDLVVTIENEISNIIKYQNKYNWVFSPLRSSNYDLSYQIQFNQDKLYQYLNSREEFKKENMEIPTNARIGEYNEQEKRYELIPANEGNYIYRYKVYHEIENAILDLKSEIDLDDINGYRYALINENNKVIKEPINQLNRLVSTNITYQFGENEEILDGDIIHEWIHLDNQNVYLDEESVLEYVKELSRKYDTAYRKHKFVTYDGDNIVIDKGHYGWWMNRKEEANQLIELIKNGEKIVRKPIYFQEAAAYGECDYGNTYVEIDLTKQHLYFWIDGEIYLESDFVSGNVTRGNATPDGIYPITYKERNATLKGADYRNDVAYWMPFNGGIGMHDASWRNKFGGKIYLTNGSHGCINLPVDIAEQIFEQVYTGMPVICYYSKDE